MIERNYLEDQMYLLSKIPGVYSFDLRNFITKYMGIENGKINLQVALDANVFLPEKGTINDLVIGNWGEAVMLMLAIAVPETEEQLEPFFEEAARNWMESIREDISFKRNDNGEVAMYVANQQVSGYHTYTKQAMVDAFKLAHRE